MCSLNSEIV
jgi:hypothetical protein